MDLARALVRHGPLRELAGAIRARAGEITLVWTREVEEAIPRMRGKSFDELKDNVPAILEGMARAVEGEDGEAAEELVRQSPVQGVTRYGQGYSLDEIMEEDRLLRVVIVREVEGELGRRVSAEESAALHGVVDVMLQRAVVALAGEQQGALRAAAEKEMRYLSFLSHDLNNSLNGVVLTLQLASVKLTTAADCAAVASELRLAEETVLTTIGGMRQLLERESLRRGMKEGKVGVVDVDELVRGVVRGFAREAELKRLSLTALVTPGGMVLGANRELLTLVLQNLVCNAIKYTQTGGVAVAAELVGSNGGGRRVAIRVSDTGPGIAEEGRAALFEAFRRGEGHEQPGLGLGLAIASQAAKMMGAELSVESAVGEGSVFTVVVGGEVWAGGEGGRERAGSRG